MKKRAFTLIELVVVVAIIGILATLVMVNYIGAQAKSRDSKRKADVEAIASALEMYKSTYGNFFNMKKGIIDLSSSFDGKTELSKYLPNINSLEDPKNDGTTSVCGSVYNYCIYIYPDQFTDSDGKLVSTSLQAYAVVAKMETSAYNNYDKCYKSSNLQSDPGIVCDQ